MSKEGKRSPFPRPSLPQAGESLGQTALELFLDRLFILRVMGGTMAIVAILDWWYWWMDVRRLPRPSPHFLHCLRRPSPSILLPSDRPRRARMRETFLFVGADPDFAEALFTTLESAGKFVLRAHSVDDALATLHRLGIDSILIDPAFADDPALAILKGAAAAANSDFWILDAARSQKLLEDLSTS